tara:strand:+ start:3484 stop:4302 length:819 start_codon:yes stop_codon:yes gene_type:complete
MVKTARHALLIVPAQTNKSAKSAPVAAIVVTENVTLQPARTARHVPKTALVRVDYSAPQVDVARNVVTRSVMSTKAKHVAPAHKTVCVPKHTSAAQVSANTDVETENVKNKKARHVRHVRPIAPAQVTHPVSMGPANVSPIATTRPVAMMVVAVAAEHVPASQPAKVESAPANINVRKATKSVPPQAPTNAAIPIARDAVRSKPTNANLVGHVKTVLVARLPAKGRRVALMDVAETAGSALHTQSANRAIVSVNTNAPKTHANALDKAIKHA